MVYTVQQGIDEKSFVRKTYAADACVAPLCEVIYTSLDVVITPCKLLVFQLCEFTWARMPMTGWRCFQNSSPYLAVKSSSRWLVALFLLRVFISLLFHPFVIQLFPFHLFTLWRLMKCFGMLFCLLKNYNKQRSTVLLLKFKTRNQAVNRIADRTASQQTI